MLAITSVAARTDPMVGRRSELEQLDAALAALGAGSPACLAVEGEPGIGKTRLLAELRRRAEDRGHLVLSGSAAEFERDLPYGVWVEALDAYVASQEFAARAGRESDFLSDAAGVLPSLRARNESPATALGDERHRSHRAMRRLLALIAERDPLVLVLDDLHWSDAASVELIGAFVRRGMAARVLLGLGYRTGRAPAGLSSALAAPGVTVLELGSLSEAECRSLAGGDAPGTPARGDLQRERRQPVLRAAARARRTAAGAQPVGGPHGDRRRRPAHGGGRPGGGAGRADRSRAQAPGRGLDRG